MQHVAKSRKVGAYEIQTGNDVYFKVILLENEDGLREFEIVLSANGSDDYSEVYNHPFYQNFIIPWVHRAKDIPTPDNVVSMANYKSRGRRK